MDKIEYKIKAEEIKVLIAKGEYVEAVKIADTIDWRRVKSVMMLCTISDLYKLNRRFEESKELLLLAYERHPGGRTIVYSLCELSIKMEEYVQAIEYYKEFVQIAPKDNGRYVLQYKLYEAQDVSLEERIAVLEELKKKEYREKWAYELAYLYHRIGLGTKCVEECDELILWFGEGRYVIKAMELKMLHQPLTPEQQHKYDMQMYGTSDYTPEEEAQEESDEQEPYLPEEGALEEYGQEEYGGEPYIQEDYTEGAYGTEEETQDQDGYAEEAYQQESFRYESYEGDETVEGQEQYEGGNARRYQDPELEEIMNAPTAEIPAEDIDIQVKTLDMGKYNTINLQKELAASMKELLDEEPAPSADSVTQPVTAPLFENTEEMDAASYAAAFKFEAQQPAAEEIFFEETGEIPVETTMTETTNEAVEAMGSSILPGPPQDTVEETETGPELEQAPAADTGKIVLDEIKQEEQIPKETAEETLYHILPEVPKQLAGMLSQEPDGQISLVVPEADKIEKQITGQLSIEDVLKEWEKTKKVNEEKRKEDVRRRVMAQTGNLFAEFDEATRSGILAGLEELDAAVKEKEVQKEEETGLPEFPEADEELEEIIDFGDEEVMQDAEILEAELEEPEEFPGEEELPDETVDEAEQGLGQEDSDLRDMTEEEKELFGSYINTRKAKEQFIRAIDSISLTSYTGNVIITGDDPDDTMTVSKNIIKEVQSYEQNFSGKVAKVSGVSLNRKDVDTTLGRLENGALIVENACDIDAQTADRLHHFLDRENTGILVILEGTMKAMNKFLKANEGLERYFNARIDIEALDNDSLAAYGRKYAQLLEYTIDDLGMLALHTRISDMQTSTHIVNVAEVREIVDEAIRSANKKNFRHFVDILIGKRYDEEDMIILRERDFI